MNELYPKEFPKKIWEKSIQKSLKDFRKSWIKPSRNPEKNSSKNKGRNQWRIPGGIGEKESLKESRRNLGSKTKKYAGGILNAILGSSAKQSEIPNKISRGINEENSKGSSDKMLETIRKEILGKINQWFLGEVLKGFPKMITAVTITILKESMKELGNEIRLKSREKHWQKVMNNVERIFQEIMNQTPEESLKKFTVNSL